MIIIQNNEWKASLVLQSTPAFSLVFTVSLVRRKSENKQCSLTTGGVNRPLKGTVGTATKRSITQRLCHLT
jgi:hypothetical protein